jgi:hypothetical protein
MSQVISPPDIYFNGINFNSSFYAEDTAGFTESQANKLYLRKTVADTAPVIETFTAGIKTNSIDTTDATGATTCSLFPNATNAIIDLGPTSAPVGQSSLIRLGLGSDTVQCGSTTSKLVSQTIDSFVGSATAISLYSSKTNAIAMGTTSTAITIGTSQVGGNTLQLGSSSSAVSIPGGTTISSITTNTINATSTLSSLSLNATLNSQINIGTLTSRGTGIFIGSGNSATGQVYINTGGTASGATNIMTGVNQSGNFNLGDAGNAVVININRPLTIGYAPSAITTTSQIGYTVRDTIDFTGAYTSSTAGTFFTSYKTLPAGVWLIQFSSRVRSAGTSTLTRWYFWGENSVDGSAPINAYTSSSATTVIDNEGLSAAGTFTVTSDGSVGYNIFAYFVYSGSAVNIDKSAGFGSNVKRTRIA